MQNKIHCDKRSTDIQINLILKIRDYKFEMLDHQV